MPAEAVIKKLKEKLILTALESPEFKDLLKETLSTIKEYAEIAENEASIESVFEKELYGLLRNINFRFLPIKEFPVETRRHIGKGRIDSKIDAVIIEYKHYSKLTTKGDISKAIDQLETYIRGLSSKNPLYYYGFLTDGIKCLEIIFENNEKKSQSGLVKITEQETFRLIKNIVLFNDFKKWED